MQALTTTRLRSDNTAQQRVYKFKYKFTRRTAAVTTARSSFQIEDPSRGPGKVDFMTPDGGSRLQGARNPRSGGTIPKISGTLYVGRRCTKNVFRVRSSMLVSFSSPRITSYSFPRPIVSRSPFLPFAPSPSHLPLGSRLLYAPQ